MNKTILLLIGILGCFVSCKDNSANTSFDVNQQVILDSLSKEKVNVSLLALSKEAEKKIAFFDDFKNLRSLLITMQGANPFFIKKYADSTELLIQNFNENLDEGGDLSVNSIKSRIVVLSTESGLLNELATKKNPIPQKLLDANIRLLAAYNSLIIQLNELSLEIPENIEKDLLRDPELLRDSIVSPDTKLVE